MQTIDTERLLLRAFRQDDAWEVHHHWACDEKIMDAFNQMPHPNLHFTERKLAEKIVAYNDPNFFAWGIVEKKTQKLIGSISSTKSRESDQCLAYVLGEAWWNQGYMTEALEAVIHYFFEMTDTNCLYAYHHISNRASGRVMQKVGMHYLGLRMKMMDGHFHQYPYYELRKEWY